MFDMLGSYDAVFDEVSTYRYGNRVVYYNEIYYRVCISLYLFNTSSSIPFVYIICVLIQMRMDSVGSLSPSLYSPALVKHAPFVEKKCTIDIYARKGKV
mgnify:CR=1 FL=1